MEPFEIAYGILSLIAAKKVKDEEEDFIDRDDFWGELEVL